MKFNCFWLNFGQNKLGFRMLSRKTFVVVFVILSADFISPQDKNIGLGLMLGEPTGISAKYWTSPTNAWDFGLGYSFVNSQNKISVHADYLYHINDLIKAKYRIPFYYGFGVRLRFHNNESSSIGGRGVAGLVLLVDEIPIDVFFELAPVFNLFPSTSLNLDAAIGARYYFK